ncbi:uncharacterized protein LOC136081846 isoform X3 [Hydra vulgaris]|uniref:Uncharacterized protein LOC136081846 isoform X3 n=1 Tax=Hydra vulgaris TaxID=6087 RepID=A0ABM4C3Q6_HYDVU
MATTRRTIKRSYRHIDEYNETDNKSDDKCKILDEEVDQLISESLFIASIALHAVQSGISNSPIKGVIKLFQLCLLLLPLVHHGGEDRPGFRWASNLPYSGAGPDSGGQRFNGRRGNRRTTEKQAEEIKEGNGYNALYYKNIDSLMHLVMWFERRRGAYAPYPKSIFIPLIYVVKK